MGEKGQAKSIERFKLKPDQTAQKLKSATDLKPEQTFESNQRKAVLPEQWAKKGCITYEDLKALTENLGEQVEEGYLKDMVLTLDWDEDGVLGPDDFYNAINHASQIMVEKKNRANVYANLAPTNVGNVGNVGNFQRSATG